MFIILVPLMMLLVIFLWSACVVSSRISKEEEKYELEVKTNENIGKI